MFSIPFAAYDVFGYLAAGAVTITGVQLLFDFPGVLGRDLTAIESGVALLSMYVAGQLVATPAETILEDWLVHRVIGPPSDVLFRSRPGRWSYLFPGYHEPLPSQITERVRAEAGRAGITGVGEPLFQLARHSERVTTDAQAVSRLATFLAQYGFARNIAFVCLVLGPALLIQARWHHQPNAAAYGVIAIIVGVVFVYRFLKFYRAYSLVVFHRFGVLRDALASPLH